MNAPTNSTVDVAINKTGAPIITTARYNALRSIIIGSRLAQGRKLPKPDLFDVMTTVWNAALRRIPTDLLEPALQLAIETYRGNGKITCSIIYQAYLQLSAPAE